MKTSSGNNFGPRPSPKAGDYLARNYGIIDLGTHPKEFKGKKTETRVIRMSFELLGTKAVFNPEKGEQPFTVHTFDMTNSLFKSGLNKFLSSWRGKAVSAEEEKNGIDLFHVFGGKACQITVELTKGDNDAVYANIGKDPVTKFPLIRPVPDEQKEKVKTMDCENPVVMFEIEGKSTINGKEYPWREVMGVLPEFIQDKIRDSKEYKELPTSDVPQESKQFAAQQNAKDEF